MNKIELEIVAISQSFTQNHSYAVVLGETIGKRRLPIVIGGSEAQAIAVAMENMNPSRPLTTTFHIQTHHRLSIRATDIKTPIGKLHGRVGGIMGFIVCSYFLQN